MEPREVLMRYIQDAEAAERNFEDALATFSKAGEQPAVQAAFAQMSEKAKTQHQRLRQRLEALGGTPSEAKSILAHMLAFGPTIAQIGHDASEKNTQHLMIVFAAAAAEQAMYEALATVAEEAGDVETQQLARQLQREEKQDYDVAWGLLRQSALASFQAVTGMTV